MSQPLSPMPPSSQEKLRESHAVVLGAPREERGIRLTVGIPMQNKISFNKFALTLAALSAGSLSVGAASASSVHMTEQGETALGEKDEKKDPKKPPKKDKKKHGDEGGCGAGSCG